MIPADVAARVAKLLPMLASDHDGEVVGTVRAIGRVLDAAKLDWHALSAAITAPTAPVLDFSDFASCWTEPDTDRDAPEAPARKFGLPIWGVKKIEPWSVVAGHCLDLDWTIPKACGGRFLTKDERDRLRIIKSRGSVSNATAAWVESLVERCHAVRDAWRSGRRAAA